MAPKEDVIAQKTKQALGASSSGVDYESLKKQFAGYDAVHSTAAPKPQSKM
jgi:hypothetical protein